MGLNTIHDSSEDFMQSKNITKNCDVKGTILSNIDYSRIEPISGLPITKFSFVIRCNGWVNVDEGDKIKTPLSDKIYVVVKKTQTFDNSLQFKHRKDVGNFTGNCDIFLE